MSTIKLNGQTIDLDSKTATSDIITEMYVLYGDSFFKEYQAYFKEHTGLTGAVSLDDGDFQEFFNDELENIRLCMKEEVAVVKRRARWHPSIVKKIDFLFTGSIRTAIEVVA